MEKIIVTNPFVGIAHMQVCAANDATDEEILAVCNATNPAGTTNGWSHVCRNDEPDEFWGPTCPVQCSDDKGRTHFLIAC